MIALQLLRKILLHGAMLMCLANALPAQAQSKSSKVDFPQGLEWQMMREVTFDYAPRKSGTDQERAISESLWAKELAARPTNRLARADGTKLTGKYPGFVLISSINVNDNSYIFSMFDSINAECEKAADGRNVVDMYSKCAMRVVRRNQDGKVTQSQVIPDFCFLNLDDQDAPLDKNHTEIAYDAPNKTVYFRTIQTGKVVTACNRAVRVG